MDWVTKELKLCALYGWFKYILSYFNDDRLSLVSIHMILLGKWRWCRYSIYFNAMSRSGFHYIKQYIHFADHDNLNSKEKNWKSKEILRYMFSNNLVSFTHKPSTLMMSRRYQTLEKIVVSKLTEPKQLDLVRNIF